MTLGITLREIIISKEMGMSDFGSSIKGKESEVRILRGENFSLQYRVDFRDKKGNRI